MYLTSDYIVALEVTIPALLASKGLGVFNDKALRVTEPNEKSTIHHADALKEAAKARVASIAPDAPPLLVHNNPVQPTPETDARFLASQSQKTLKDGRPISQININPNADAVYYAHELGHGVSQKTKTGAFVNKAKHALRSNPKLGKALGLALVGAVPTIGAALEEGDDDLAGSIGLAAAVASPTLVDEALASKNALAIMNDAGMRATAGQRGRLAGGYLSYLAPVIIAGSVGNALGNVADDYTAIYNISSPGEISP